MHQVLDFAKSHWSTLFVSALWVLHIGGDAWLQSTNWTEAECVVGLVTAAYNALKKKVSNG
jgi:hypothetical protein